MNQNQGELPLSKIEISGISFLHPHVSLKRGCRWGSKDNFTTSFVSYGLLNGELPLGGARNSGRLWEREGERGYSLPITPHHHQALHEEV